MSNYDDRLSSTRYPRVDRQQLRRLKGDRPIRYVPVVARGSAAGLLSIYVITLACLTLQPAYADSGSLDRLQNIMSGLSGGSIELTETEALANIALFVPAGFLLAVLLGRTWASVVLCIAASAAIELAQQRYLPSRVPSLEDVQHNSIGGAIGALTAWPLLRWVRSKAKASIRQAHITFLTEDRESWSRPRQTISEPPRVTP
jgi:hypothetical protein